MESYLNILVLWGFIGFHKPEWWKFAPNNVACQVVDVFCVHLLGNKGGFTCPFTNCLLIIFFLLTPSISIKSLKAIVMKYYVLRPRAGTFWEKMPEKNKHRRILFDRKKMSVIGSMDSLAKSESPSLLIIASTKEHWSGVYQSAVRPGLSMFNLSTML